jgi:hypothetical protein
MVVTAISSLGTILRKEGAVIADVKGISGPALTRDLADVTALDSVNGFEEVLPTILRTGDVTFTLAFNPDDVSHINLRDDVVTASGKNFEIVFPPTAASGTVQTHSFEAFVTNYTNQIETGAEITADVTLKPTSTITVTTA